MLVPIEEVQGNQVVEEDHQKEEAKAEADITGTTMFLLWKMI